MEASTLAKCATSAREGNSAARRTLGNGSPHLFHFEGDATSINPIVGNSKQPARLGPRRVSETEDQPINSQGGTQAAHGPVVPASACPHCACNHLQEPQQWAPKDSANLYNLPGWGAPYFDANAAGNLICKPHGKVDQAVDVEEIVQKLRDAGIHPPVLLRFPDIAAHRMARLQGCFEAAIKRFDYAGSYRIAYPTKCNHDRRLIESLLTVGLSKGAGLEAGSKAELALCISVLAERPGSLLICNGYKDSSYMEMALRARQLGINAYIVLEQVEELPLALEAAQRLGVRPALGVRARLATHHGGHWGSTSGDLAKFGLRCQEIVHVVGQLDDLNMLDCLQLLHFHAGSQISDIRIIKEAMREASFLYAELLALGAPMTTVDVGGGLGIDYEGTGTDRAASLNYSMQNYANDVVAALKDVCIERNIPGPQIVSESGRALASHHAIVVFEVMKRPSLPTVRPDRASMDGGAAALASETPKLRGAAASGKGKFLLAAFHEMLDGIRPDAGSLCEAYNDAIYFKDEALRAFKLGILSLEERAEVDVLFEVTCAHIHDTAAAAGLQLPDALRPCGLPLSAMYHVNFSVFRSAIDSWAIGQVFPVIPTARLDEEPRVAATLADITCDSDGVLARFISTREAVDYDPILPLHELRDGQPYHLAMFLTGVYQEAMGSAHNMLGAPHVAEVRLKADTPSVPGTGDEAKSDIVGSNFAITNLALGETIGHILARAQHQSYKMIEAVRAATERAVSDGNITDADGDALVATYKADLASHTYLSS